jgi:hypothetical protein
MREDARKAMSWTKVAGVFRFTRSACVVAITSCLSLLSGGSASAATQVGQGFVPDTGCVADTFLQTAVSSGASYTVPSAGVITYWYFRDGASPIASGLKLKVGRLSLAGATIIGDSTAPALRPLNSLNGPYLTRIPVHAGDIIGIYTSGTGNCSLSTSNTSDHFVDATGDLAPGTTTPVSAADSFRFPVAAFVEPDADGDGFGDESQDFCATDPTTQGPCRPGTVTFGSQRLGARTAPQVVTLLNTASSMPLSISSISAGGDFVVTGSSCGATIAVGTSCTVSVAFQPIAVGGRLGTLSIADAANGSPHTITLSGTGTATATATSTGARAPALKRCKKKFHKNHNKRAFKKCKKKAKLLPI